MGDFQNPPVQLDVTFGTQNLGAESSFPRMLQISVSDAQQVFPTQGGLVNTVVLFAGTARFGVEPQEDDIVAVDPENKVDEAITVDEGVRTLYLQLHIQQQQFLF